MPRPTRRAAPADAAGARPRTTSRAALFLIARRRQTERAGDHVAAVESDIDTSQSVQADQQQTGDDEQRRRDGKLTADEHAAQAADRRAAGRRSAHRSQRLVDRTAACRAWRESGRTAARSRWSSRPSRAATSRRARFPEFEAGSRPRPRAGIGYPSTPARSRLPTRRPPAVRFRRGGSGPHVLSRRRAPPAPTARGAGW